MSFQQILAISMVDNSGVEMSSFSKKLGIDKTSDSLIEKFKYDLKGIYTGLDILGPAPCFLEKLKNNYRFQLVFKSNKSYDPNGSLLHAFIRKNFKVYENKKPLRQNRINIYFDPITLI